MTSTPSIAIAISLLINEINLFYKCKIITDDHPESKLMFLLSVCLLLKKVGVVPNFVRARYIPIYALIEIPLSVMILESSLHYVWVPLKNYLLLHSDDVLVHLYNSMDLEWLICPLCCEKNNCSYTFAALVLKVASFLFLLTICFAAKK